jgi:hypothetical protein
MCYFSAYERLQFHVPLFVAAVLMTICSSIMICYGAAREYRELWIIGIVIGCFALLTVIFAFFIVCMLYNPKSWYRVRLGVQHNVVYAPRIYTGPRSVISYPSVMRIQPPLLPADVAYRPVINDSEAPSVISQSHQVYDMVNNQGIVSPPSSVLGRDRNGMGYKSPSISGSEQGRYYQHAMNSMSPSYSRSDRPLI